MAAMGGAIIGLACLFYGYCLVKFAREMMPSRKNKMTCYGLSSPGSRGGAVALGAREKIVALGAPQVVTAGGRVDSQIVPFGRSAYANTILTLGKSRLTVPPSLTGRLTAKRAAKG